MNIVPNAPIYQWLFTQYHRIKNFFTSGAFGVKFYPFLMYPCVRHAHSLFIKGCGVLAVFIGLDFFFAELIAILFSQRSLASYLHHSVFELSLATGTIIDNQTINLTPLHVAVRASFLLQGYVFALIYLIAIRGMTQRFRFISGLLAVSFACGMILSASAEGGKWTVGGLQNVGINLTFLLGNITLIITGLAISDPKLRHFNSWSLIAGGIGVIAILFPLFEPTPYLPLFERASLYAILIWEIVAGFAILKQVK